MKTYIKLIKNWNNKLGCNGFTVILPDEGLGMYQKGKLLDIFLRDDALGSHDFEGDKHKYAACGTTEIISVQSLPFDTINDAMAAVEIGHNAAFLQAVYKRIYNRHYKLHGPKMPMLRLCLAYTKNSAKTGLTPDQFADMIEAEIQN